MAAAENPRVSPQSPHGPAYEPSPDAHPEPVPLVSEADLVNPLLTVREVMTPGPATCSTFSTAVEAALVFRACGCGILPVVDAGKLVGVLTDRDLALALPDRGGDLSRATVGDLMTRDVVTADADSPLQAAVDRMSAEGLRRLLVVGDDGQLLGVLSWTDLVPHVSERGLGHVVKKIVENR